MGEERKWTDGDLESSLRRAFTGVNLDTYAIIYDGHTARNPFLRAVFNFGIEKGWLSKPIEGGDSQWTEYHYFLSEKGKEYFGKKEPVKKEPVTA